jgi:hypothetical protein
MVSDLLYGAEVKWQRTLFAAGVVHFADCALHDPSKAVGREMPSLWPSSAVHSQTLLHGSLLLLCAVLAFVSEKPNPRAEMPPKSLGRFFSTAVVDMITTAPEAPAYATNERLITQLNRLALHLSDGNMAAMHRQLGLRERPLSAGFVKEIAQRFCHS